MLNEVKILFENIKAFRHLITEAVGAPDMIDYINNHEWIYIYYAGDGKNKRGYRTIRPYVLGTTKDKTGPDSKRKSTAGHEAVRAWQDVGKSVSMSTGTRGMKHDYWIDNDGDEKAGWRLFRLDRIEKVYPIGRKFNNKDGSVMIPPDYNENGDGDLINIQAQVTSRTGDEVRPEIPEPASGTTTGKVTKWENFSQGNAQNRKIEARDVAKLSDIASRVYKKKKGSFLVAINNNNEYELIGVNDRNKVPEAAIVDNLPHLYDTLVKPNAVPDERYFQTAKQKADSNIKNQQKNTELPTIPFEKKPFFKQ